MKIYAYSSILTCLIVLPVIGSMILAFLPSARVRLIRGSALALFAGMLIIAGVAARLLNWSVAASNSGLQQLNQDLLWIPSLNIHYHVAADPLSMIFILALCFLAIISCLASYSVDQRVKTYYILLLLLTGTLIGAVAATDLFLFYLFATLAIFPAYCLIGLWGGARREPAAMKMALFAIIGSMSMLMACIILSWASRGTPGYPNGTFNIIALTHQSPLRHIWGATQGLPIDGIIFWLMFIGIAIRLGVPFLHLWLPDVAAESPVPAGMLIIGGNVIFSGYALLRILGPVMSLQSHQVRFILMTLGAFGSLYAALCALAQSDLRRIIAYWLIFICGIMLVGAASMQPNGINGILLLSLACPVSLCLLLWLSHVIEKRAFHHDINRFGGLAQIMPDLLGYSSIGFLSALGLPGLCLFAGEFLILSGVFQSAFSLGEIQGHWYMICGIVLLAALTLTAAYLLWAAERIFFGQIRPEHHHYQKLSLAEKTVFIPLIIFAVALGLFMVFLILIPAQPVLLDLFNLITK